MFDQPGAAPLILDGGGHGPATVKLSWILKPKKDIHITSDGYEYFPYRHLTDKTGATIRQSVYLHISSRHTIIPEGPRWNSIQGHDT